MSRMKARNRKRQNAGLEVGTPMNLEKKMILPTHLIRDRYEERVFRAPKNGWGKDGNFYKNHRQVPIHQRPAREVQDGNNNEGFGEDS